MKTSLLALAASLLAALASPLCAAPPPDLVLAARQIEQLATPHGQESANAQLARFFDLYWSTRMREFPDLATYVGYPGLDDRWPDLSPETFALIHRIARLELAALDAIDRGRLSPAEQVDFDLARRRLERQIEGERFHELEPFRSEVLPEGLGLDLVELLSAMPARTVADFEAMLARLRGFPAAATQVIACLDRGLAAGITPPRVTLRGAADEDPSLAGDPLKTPILAPFQRFPETIPEAERERLRRAAAQVFTADVVPALRRLQDYFVHTYIPRARTSIAMADLPDGKAWYAHELKNHTTTDLSPDEIHRLGLAEVARIRREMDALIAKIGFHGSFAEFCRYLRTDPRFFYTRPEDLVAAYRDIAKRIDPELIRLFGRLPRLPYGVKPMDEGAAKWAPAGYYDSGSLRSGRPGWFLVNTYDLKSRPKWEMEALILHEAVPGHHLQYSLAEEIENLPDWRKWDIYPTFSEGWAFYAEGLGSELGLYRDPYSDFGRLTNQVWRAVRLVVDTGIHTRGWTRQQAIDYYTANCAKTARDIEVEVDRIIRQPGTVPVYKLGELKIRELRSFAERELGARFDLRAFHDQLLGRGPLPLDLLDKSIREWVAKTRAAGAEGIRREPAGAAAATPALASTARDHGSAL
jgi:uncharacterized protein (DUF885 family)